MAVPYRYAGGIQNDTIVLTGIKPTGRVHLGSFPGTIQPALETGQVPAGHDQVQHFEIARDVAAAFNHAFGPVLKMPQALIGETVETITGLDGLKMS